MTSIQSFRPEDVGFNISEACIWNAMLSYRGCPLPLNDRGVTAKFDVLDEPSRLEHFLLVNFGDGHRAVIAITHFPFREAFDADLDVGSMHAIPAGLRDALNEGIIGLLWTSLPQHHQGRCEILQTGCRDDLAALVGAGLSWLDVSISGLFAEVVRLEIGCHAPRLVDIMLQGKIAPRQAWSNLKTQISTEVFVTIDRLSMSVAQVRGLRCGDVVVLNTSHDPRLRLRVEDMIHVIARVDEGWMFVDTVPAIASFQKDFLMHELTESDAVFDNLLIAIDFDIGQRRVALSEVESWQKGSLVQIDISPTSPGIEVTIHANGRVLATGDLLRIDDRLAVRLNRLHFKAEATD